MHCGGRWRCGRAELTTSYFGWTDAERSELTQDGHFRSRVTEHGHYHYVGQSVGGVKDVGRECLPKRVFQEIVDAH